MALQVEKLEKNMAKLTIEVSAEELEKAIDKAYHKNKGKISLPGFRKGKIPRQIIEKMYGKEIFYDDAANALIPDAYDQAMEECSEEIVSSPKITVTQIEAGKPFIFEAEVALKPPVGLGKYKGVKVKAQDNTVTDEEVDAAINKEREANARNLVVEDRPVQNGDMTVIDFEGFVDGVAFEGGKGEDYSLTIGSGAFIPGFEEQLIGVETGGQKEVQVTFPEDYHAAELAGKEAVFHCTIKEIKEKELPELDDEFASEVSEFDTLAEYREDLKVKLASEKEENNKNALENEVVEAIIADSDMEIPEAMIETQQNQLMEDMTQRLRMQGMSMEQYFQFTGMNSAKLAEQMRPQAEARIRSRLVLEAVVAAEQIQVSEEEYEAEIAKMAESYRTEADKIKAMMGQSGEKQVRMDLAIEKAVAFVAANAKPE